MALAPRTENAAFADLAEVCSALRGATVVVLGDMMLDRFVYGDVHRISPESPVPVLTVARENSMLGGAGNVLSNLQGLGVKTLVMACIGDDEAGSRVRALVREKSVSDDLILTLSDRPTTIKTRFLAAHQQLLRTDSERIVPLSAADEQRVLEGFEKISANVGAVVLSDYGKGFLTPVVIKGVIALAKKQGIPVLVDPKGSDYTIYSGATVVTPNRKELSEATGGRATKTDDEVISAAQEVIQKSGITNVVATRSQDGMTIIQSLSTGKGFVPPVHLRTEALEVFDVSGAGDTVIATIAAGMAAGASLVAATTLANLAGGIVVAKVGTAAIRYDELLERLGRYELGTREGGAEGTASIIDRTREARICRAEEAAEEVQRWKARGLKVGFTNGCFDILHLGHVNYLNRARDRCDRLVVGLNADESVRRLKGDGRPANNQESRSAVMAALGAVDMVVIFGDTPAEDDKPLKLLERLKPDIAFKGGDYKVEQLPETPLVRSYGGEMVILELYEGHSTTATIGRLKGAA